MKSYSGLNMWWYCTVMVSAYNMTAFKVFLSDEIPFWVRRVMIPPWFQNVIQSMRDMDDILDKSYSDLDYTAVKICFGRGEDESGMILLISLFHLLLPQALFFSRKVVIFFLISPWKPRRGASDVYYNIGFRGEIRKNIMRMSSLI